MPYRESLRRRIICETIKKPCFLILLFLIAFYSGCSPKEPSGPSVDNFLETGNQAVADRNWGQAISEFTKIIEKDPADKDALYRRSGVYLAKAKDHYNLAQAAASKREKTTAQTEAKTADDNFALAEKDARAALEIDQKYTNALYILGCINIYQGDWKGAEDAFSKCIEEDPKHANAYQRRGEIHQYLGDEANALTDLKKASELGYKGK